MFPRIKTLSYVLLLMAFCLSPVAPVISGQEQRAAQNPPPAAATAPQQDEVLRISTDLVQTDITVVDGKGNFVEGLQRDQFELLVDGQPQPINFFDRIVAGSASEETQLRAARGLTQTLLPPTQPRGRSIIFFVDDLHQTTASVKRTRDLLTNFIDGMGINDQAMVVSASGQIGFLQQLTDNKKVLLEAVARLKYQSRNVGDFGSRPMTVYQALAIEQNQRDVLDYKINEAMDELGERNQRPDPLEAATPPPAGPPGRRQPPPPPPQPRGGTDLVARRASLEREIRNRAHAILQQEAGLNTGLLSALESLTRGAASLSGRKLLFFISDGFIVDQKNSDAIERLQRITDVSARSGVVIYTVDTKGLSSNTADASAVAFADTRGRGASSGMGYNTLANSEGMALQGVLRTLANDTGGRAILNTNGLEKGVSKVLTETDNYYLIAWRPAQVDQSGPKFRTLKVSVKGRPDLTVRARRGFFVAPPSAYAKAGDAAAGPRTAEDDLRAAIMAPGARKEMPVTLYTIFKNSAAEGSLLTASVEITGYAAGASAAAGDKGNAKVDLVCVVFDSSGKAATSLGRELTIPAAASAESAQASRVITNLPLTLAPGIYQVRVAARDAQTARVGSAFQWVEIPDFKPGKMSLSSLLLAEQKLNESQKDADTSASHSLALNIDRRFARSSHMLLQVYIYNALAQGGLPDVTMEIQILRNNKLAISAPPHPVQTANSADLSRIKYVAEIPLKGLPPGLYTLQVTATDRKSKITSSQQTSFMVEADSKQ